ncbi:hypothetical protein FC98_GL001721 [Lentilactobacillus kisonensis DSM 19906 = JCM 15041]|uniref:Uncharacterized protein n=1 Tax=Lentilactobacillus kisonensis DSM 19906 = JCM 15041 TaxID=1423766 RepID=A0A0R1NVB0_9LACO|nr:hypothetical protein FC98_GL001721 [Lentilactobacillus kisonensis DSM 19906 = JCM 15041]
MSRYQARYTNSFKRQLRKTLKTPGNYREEIAVVIDLLYRRYGFISEISGSPFKRKVV